MGPSPTSALRILIVEDHTLLIEGIRSLLNNQPRYNVVGVVSDGLAVYQACQYLAPDMILLDLGLPGMDGVDVILQLQQRKMDVRIVVVTASTETRRCHTALTAGALACVLKQSSQQVLLAALQHAALGRSYVDPALKLETLVAAEHTSSLGDAPLTRRERQTLKLVAEGRRNREIAECLSISLKTVETHRLNLMRKLDAHNAAELSNWARRLGILEL